MARVRGIEQTHLTHDNVFFNDDYSQGAEINNDEHIRCIFVCFRRYLIAINAIMYIAILGMLLFKFIAPPHQNQQQVLSNNANLDVIADICAKSMNGTCTKNETPPPTLNIAVKLFGEIKYVNSTEYKTYVEKISFEDINDKAVPVKFQFNMQMVGVNPNVSSLGGRYLQCEATILNFILKMDAESSFFARFFGKKGKRSILRLTRGCFHLPEGIKLNINLHSFQLIPIVMASKLLSRTL